MGQIFVDDQEIMDEIIENSKLIGSVYKRLLFEHIKSGTNTKQYSLLLETLEDCIKVENNLYQKLDVTPEKTSYLIDYLIVTERSNVEQGNNVLHAIYKEDYNKLYLYRIVNRLINLSLQLKDEYLIWLVEENTFFNSENVEAYFNDKLFRIAMDGDFERIFMYHLNERLLASCSEKEKERLAKIKYNLVYLSNDLEKVITNRNTSSSEIYYSFPYIGELCGIDKSRREDMQIRQCSTYASHAMRGMFIKDDLVDEDVEIDFEIFKMYLRTGLGFIYELWNHQELIYMIKDKILETNDDTNNRLQISSSALFEELNAIEKAKPKCKYLHFVQPK